MRERLRGALHAGVKRALAVISSHYVVAEDDEEAEKEVMKLEEVAEAPGAALASLFEEEVVPPTPSADAGDSES